jgi:hypothetical protein
VSPADAQAGLRNKKNSTPAEAGVLYFGVSNSAQNSKAARKRSLRNSAY